MKQIFILFSLFCVTIVHGQINYDGDYFYGGLSYNHYVFGLTPFEIYGYDINQLESNTNKHGKLNYMPGIIGGVNMERGKLKGKIEYSYNRRVSSASYSALKLADSTIFKVDEKLKMTYGYVKIGGILPIKRFALGLTMDMGVFNNRIKRKGGDYSGKWTKFLTQTGLTNDFRARSFTAGFSASASFLMSQYVQLSVSRQFLFLDADFNRVKDLQDFNINAQHFQFSVCILFK